MIKSRSTSYGLLALPAAACEAEAEAESIFSVLGASFLLVPGGEYSPYCPSGVGCGFDDVTERIGKRGG